MNVSISYSNLRQHIEYIEKENRILREIEIQLNLFLMGNEFEFNNQYEQIKQVKQYIETLMRSMTNKKIFIEDTIFEFRSLEEKNQAILDEIASARQMNNIVEK